ncbi:MAG: hypothetical protein QOF33_92 [Thermomicrobiales bacterium]|nr:hypothetical protein [Thermomicrobiales bacterium]
MITVLYLEELHYFCPGMEFRVRAEPLAPP